MLINIVYIGFSIFRILDTITRWVTALSCGGVSLLEHATLQHKHKWKTNNWRKNMTPALVMSLPSWAEVLFISCLNDETVCFQHNQVFMYWFGPTKSEVSLTILFLFFIYPLHTPIQLQTSKYICPLPGKQNSIQMIKQPIWICQRKGHKKTPNYRLGLQSNRFSLQHHNHSHSHCRQCVCVWHVAGAQHRFLKHTSTTASSLVPPAEGNTAAQKQVWKNQADTKQKLLNRTPRRGLSVRRGTPTMIGNHCNKSSHKPARGLFFPIFLVLFCFVNLICDVTMWFSERMNAPLKM